MYLAAMAVGSGGVSTSVVFVPSANLLAISYPSAMVGVFLNVFLSPVTCHLPPACRLLSAACDCLDAQCRSAKKSHPGQIPLNSKAAQPPAQSSPNRALSNTRHARYPLTEWEGKRIPGSYFFAKRMTSYGGNMIFCILAA